MQNFQRDAPGFSVGNLDRRIGGMVRPGVIVEADYPSARYRIASGRLTSGWVPMLTGRAGSGCRTWDPPSIGEQVVMLSPGGDTARGLILPGSIYQSGQPAPGDRETLHKTEYGDGTKITLDRETSEYTIELPASGKLTLKIGASSIEMTNAGIKLLGPRIDFNE